MAIGEAATGCVDGECAPCVVEHGVADCSNSGQCGIAGCDYGYESCDADLDNGCETVTLSDLENCGYCGNSCGTPANATSICQQGSCLMECKQGFGDCNNDPDDGCETSLSNDALNCGSCGIACEGGGVCTQGACKLVCDAVHADCDGQTGNLCETDIANDAANCGACAYACHSGFNCRAGNCGCAANNANCNAGAPANAFACEALSGADKCRCSGVLCEYGQVCNGQGVCSN